MPGWEPLFWNPWDLTRCAITLVSLAINSGQFAPMQAALNETSEPLTACAAPFRRIAVFGGIYSNYLALEMALRDIRQRGVDACFCLGDLGAFGPHPDRVFPLLHDADVHC